MMIMSLYSLDLFNYFFKTQPKSIMSSSRSKPTYFSDHFSSNPGFAGFLLIFT